jgi:hypothetical protein
MGIDFLSLRDKGSCLYILSNGPMFIKKEIHDAMLRIMMKWPRTKNKTRGKIKGFNQMYSNTNINMINIAQSQKFHHQKHQN